MNDMHGAITSPEQHPESAITFTGTWKEFLPIALTNLLLTIVTLGVYRFWAKARERRYLWSRTRFIDDSLEWTGTGTEMFIGFLIVFLVLLPVLFGGQMVIEALALRGQFAAAAAAAFLLYGGILYLVGVGGFRALRYRLSRTYWHGIRGGSHDGGWSYGWQFMWKTAVGFLALGLLLPWSMTSLWNDRWNRMSFGQHPFTAEADMSGLLRRWLFIYLIPIAAVLLMAVIGGIVPVGGSDGAAVAGAAAILVMIFLLYPLFLLVSLSYYAAYYRKVAGATAAAGLRFEFTARTKDWLKLILGNIGLVIVTLGVGLIFLGYRNWSFAVRHMEAHGAIDLDELSQSRAAAPNDAEGLADAFDIGAI